MLLTYHVIQQASENDHGCLHSYRPSRRHRLILKKVIKDNFNTDPSSNVMNFAKFTAVIGASIALKDYLENQKILPTS